MCLHSQIRSLHQTCYILCSARICLHRVTSTFFRKPEKRIKTKEKEKLNGRRNSDKNWRDKWNKICEQTHIDLELIWPKTDYDCPLGLTVRNIPIIRRNLLPPSSVTEPPTLNKIFLFVIPFLFSICINTILRKCCIGMRKREENSQLQIRDTWKSAHEYSSVPGRCKDFCDLGIVTYKLDLKLKLLRLRIESGGQICWQVSLQAPFPWRFLRSTRWLCIQR
jgi:hypothetical protein